MNRARSRPMGKALERYAIFRAPPSMVGYRYKNIQPFRSKVHAFPLTLSRHFIYIYINKYRRIVTHFFHVHLCSFASFRFVSSFFFIYFLPFFLSLSFFPLCFVFNATISLGRVSPLVVRSLFLASYHFNTHVAHCFMRLE